MPFKSKAQRRKFAQLLVKGEISDKTFEEWNRETGSDKLPERVKPKVVRASRAGKTTASKSRARAGAKPGAKSRAKRGGKSRSSAK